LHRASEKGTGSPLFYYRKGMEHLLRIKAEIEAELNKYFDGTLFFLVEVKVAPGYNIYVYADGIQNITIQQCAVISRHLEEFLETGALVPEHYLLEVSSPGMDQPLRVKEQYEKTIGREVEVILNDGRKLVGMLKEATESGICLEEVKIHKGKILDNIVHHLSFGEIKTTTKSIKF